MGDRWFIDWAACRYNAVDVPGEKNKCIACTTDTKKWLKNKNKLRIIDHPTKFQHLSGFHLA